jgi:hypothetical protein
MILFDTVCKVKFKIKDDTGDLLEIAYFYFYFSRRKLGS